MTASESGGRVRRKSETFNLLSMWRTPRNADYVRDNAFLEEALRENKREGMVLAMRARFVTLALVAVLLAVNVPWPAILYPWTLLSGFVLLGWLQVRVGRVEQSPQEMGLLMLDVLLLAAMTVLPNPFADDGWPLAARYHFDGFKYFFILLAAVAMGYSWRTVFSFGTWVVAIWLLVAGLIWIFSDLRPETQALLSAATGGDPSLLWAIDITQVAWTMRVEEVLVFLLVTITLGVNGFRMSRLLLHQAEITRERENLARHFAPTMVDLLAERNDTLAEVRETEAAVIFIDVVGFTAFSEAVGPRATIETLRRFHGEIERIVFDHGGTLDKFLGDGAMISFGTPISRSDDARRALFCVRELATISLLDDGLQIAIGAHFGPVVLGDIGSQRRLEFATIGDTVNVAARLEEATRQHHVRVLVSDDLVHAAGDTSGFRKIDPIVLRGRSGTLEVWALG